MEEAAHHPVTTEGLYHELNGRLLSFVRRRVASAEDAEDIVQTVFARIHAHRAELTETQSVSGWVHRIARNAITDHHRANASAGRATERLTREAEVHDDARADEADDPGAELARCVEPLVARLPGEYRDALALTELGGLSQKDAAAETGLSVSGMKSRVQRGRAKLGELLLECCEIELDSRRGIMGYEPRHPEDNPCACLAEPS